MDNKNKNKNLMNDYLGVVNSPAIVSSLTTDHGLFSFNICPSSVKTIPRIKKVIFQKTHTIVIWGDNEKTIVNCHKESFDKEKGLAMAIVKKIMTRNDFKKLINNASFQDK